MRRRSDETLDGVPRGVPSVCPIAADQCPLCVPRLEHESKQIEHVLTIRRPITDTVGHPWHVDVSEKIQVGAARLLERLDLAGDDAVVVA